MLRPAPVCRTALTRPDPCRVLSLGVSRCGCEGKSASEDELADAAFARGGGGKIQPTRDN